jgi:hypothetical protein
MSASAQALTGRIGVIAAIGLRAIGIISACRRCAGRNADGAGGERPAAVIGAVASAIAASDGASAIAAGDDSAPAIAATCDDGASTIAAARDCAPAITAAAAERRAAPAAATECEGLRGYGDGQEAKARQ